MSDIPTSLMFTANNDYCFVTECAHLLLAHNAPVKVKNAQGWSPLAEAISYGDRQMSKSPCFPINQKLRPYSEQESRFLSYGCFFFLIIRLF